MGEVQTVLVQNNEYYNYRLYLCGEITEPSEHIDIIQALHNAGPDDTVDLFINSGGGNLVTAIQIMDAIKHCNASVTGHLVGEALSAGGMLFLACDSWRVADFATLMIHNYTGGAIGKGHELYSSIGYMKKTYPEFFKAFYKDFLSEAEMNRVLAGEDIWMETEEIMERLNNLVILRRQAILDEEEAELKASKKKTKKK